MKQGQGRLLQIIGVLLIGSNALADEPVEPSLDIVYESSTYWLGTPKAPTPLTDAPPEAVGVYITPKIEFTPVAAAQPAPTVATQDNVSTASQVPQSVTDETLATDGVRIKISEAAQSCAPVKKCNCKTVLKDEVSNCEKETKKVKHKVCKCKTTPDALCITKKSTTTEPKQILGATHEAD